MLSRLSGFLTLRIERADGRAIGPALVWSSAAGRGLPCCETVGRLRTIVGASPGWRRVGVLQVRAFALIPSGLPAAALRMPDAFAAAGRPSLRAALAGVSRGKCCCDGWCRALFRARIPRQARLLQQPRNRLVTCWVACAGRCFVAMLSAGLRSDHRLGANGQPYRAGSYRPHALSAGQGTATWRLCGDGGPSHPLNTAYQEGGFAQAGARSGRCSWGKLTGAGGGGSIGVTNACSLTIA